MSGFDVVLLLIGAALVIISFLLAEKLSVVQNSNVYSQLDTDELREHVEALKQEVEEYLEKAKETTIDSVNDSLCHLSNEKIMSVNEYGEMVMERIDKTHSEIVFLYGMLTDKEKEVKEMFVKPNQKENQLKEIVNPPRKDTKQTKAAVGSLSGSQAAKVEQAMLEFNESDNHEVFENRQKQIITLLNQGKKVPEIAKQLDIGQGEVQLVVNLFTGGSQ